MIALHVALPIPISEQAAHLVAPSEDENEMEEQGEQLEFLPRAEEKVPAEQDRHTNDPSESVNIPGAQRSEVNPSEEYEPAGTI